MTTSHYVVNGSKPKRAGVDRAAGEVKQDESKGVVPAFPREGQQYQTLVAVVHPVP
jgi:hypothetical protein